MMFLVVWGCDDEGSEKGAFERGRTLFMSSKTPAVRCWHHESMTINPARVDVRDDPFPVGGP